MCICCTSCQSPALLTFFDSRISLLMLSLSFSHLMRFCTLIQISPLTAHPLLLPLQQLVVLLLGEMMDQSVVSNLVCLTKMLQVKLSVFHTATYAIYRTWLLSFPLIVHGLILGFMYELRDEAALSRLWGLMSRCSSASCPC